MSLFFPFAISTGSEALISCKRIQVRKIRIDRMIKNIFKGAGPPTRGSLVKSQCYIFRDKAKLATPTSLRKTYEFLI